MLKRSLLLIAALLPAAAGIAQEPVRKPKLVVNLVISQMRYDYLERFNGGFAATGGFRNFMENGAFFRAAHHNYMQTNTVAGLSTIATGANPSEHGVISENWIDFTTNRVVNLIDDNSATGIECDAGVGNYSPRQLTAATLGDKLKESDEKSKVLSIASSPASAIVSGGHLADTYWIDPMRGGWISSSYYFDQLPRWATGYNSLRNYEQLASLEWIPLKPKESYSNRDIYILSFEKDRSKSFTRQFLRGIIGKDKTVYDVEELMYTPYGNSLTTQFAVEAIVGEELGKDDHTDMLTVVYDSPRLISELFGPRSIEVEDMYYRLDTEIGNLVNFAINTLGKENVVFTLSSDHGSSDTYKEDSRVPMGRLNVGQFKMIMNGFLSAQYEPANWVTEYFDRQIYLNRELIYQYGLDLEDIQNRAAAFALQFGGVAGAHTSTSMQTGSFGTGYGEKVQNGFYPKRSGDITLNLMPGCTELTEEEKISTAGSLYEYDTHVPLIFMGGNIFPARIDRSVDMRSAAPSLAKIIGIGVPNASSGEILEEVTPD